MSMKANAVCGRVPDTPAGRHWAVSGGHRQLPKLQRFSTGGSSEDRFLYDDGWPDEVLASRVRSAGFDDTLYLKPGVGEWLVRMAGALRPIVQQRWATFVAERSRDLVDVVYLDDFLFGSARAILQRVKSPLLEGQGGSCFYCGLRANASGTEVDHFIPCSRHPANGLHNLVAAHRLQQRQARLARRDRALGALAQQVGRGPRRTPGANGGERSAPLASRPCPGHP
jgi:hypothetical protein